MARGMYSENKLMQKSFKYLKRLNTLIYLVIILVVKLITQKTKQLVALSLQLHIFIESSKNIYIPTAK